MEKGLLTTPQVAERLGIGIRRVQALIHAGRLPSQQYGRDHVIKEADLALVAIRKRGRPSKKPVSTDGEVSTATDAPDDGMPAAVTEKPAKKARKKGGDQ